MRARKNTVHVQFACPHGGQEGHEKALALVEASEETPSLRVADLLRLDLEELLQEHGRR